MDSLSLLLEKIPNPLLAIVGTIVCLVAIVKYFFRSNSTYIDLFVLLFGGIIVALPQLKSAKINASGVEIATIFTSQNDQIELLKKAVEELKTGLADAAIKIGELASAQPSIWQPKIGQKPIWESLGDTAVSVDGKLNDVIKNSAETEKLIEDFKARQFQLKF